MTDINQFMQNKREKTCLFCGKPFFAQHLSRSYCSKACKIECNNFVARSNRLSKKPTIDVLDRNVKILKNYKNGEIVLCSDLQAHGYNFEIHTFIKKDERGADYLFCYNSGIAFMDNQKTKVIVKHLIPTDARNLFFNNNKNTLI